MSSTAGLLDSKWAVSAFIASSSDRQVVFCLRHCLLIFTLSFGTDKGQRLEVYTEVYTVMLRRYGISDSRIGVVHAN
jgi:hypothetical protein